MTRSPNRKQPVLQTKIWSVIQGAALEVVTEGLELHAILTSSLRNLELATQSSTAIFSMPAHHPWQALIVMQGFNAVSVLSEEVEQCKHEDHLDMINITPPEKRSKVLQEKFLL